MTKSVTASAFDAALTHIAARADLVTLCSGAPATSSEAIGMVSIGGKSLASVVVTEGVGGGDFSLTNGLSSGRRMIVAAQTAVPIIESGVVDHVALVDTDAPELLLVAPLTEAQTVNAGEVVSVKAFGSEIAAPV